MRKIVMKKEKILQHRNVVAVILIVMGLFSCSDDKPVDSSCDLEISAIPLTEWEMTAHEISNRMKEYNEISSSNDYQLYTSADNPERYYVFRFQEGLLSASSIIMPSTDITAYVKKYTHLGCIGQKDVYTNTSTNTIATLFQEIDTCKNLCAVGFVPIASTVYKDLPMPEVTTKEAIIIDYTSVKVSGSIKDNKPNDSYGIILGNNVNLGDGIKLKADEEADFSFTLTQMDMGKTYYYCAYVDADNFTNYGNILAFSMPSPNIKVTTGDSEDITGSSSTIYGSAVITLDYDVDYDYGFFLSLSGNPSEKNNVLDVKPNKIQVEGFVANVDDLKDNTTYYYCAYVLCQGKYFYGSTKNFKTPKATKGKLAGHEWVDLGLPSGLKWATCNVDATSPEICGGYYAWGETSTKSLYGSGNYPYGNTNNHSYNIPYDISGTKYDVARQKWGETWQMPTFSNIQELYRNCTFSWTTVNGVVGAKMTGKNGNSIFLPAGGGIGAGFSGSGGTTVAGKGECGRYWSATMAYKQNWNEVKFLYFKESGFVLTSQFLGSYSDMNTNGFNGMLVRPVTK